MDNKDLVLNEAYQDYMKLRDAFGKSRKEALDFLSYLHPITLARLVKLIDKEDRDAESA